MRYLKIVLLVAFVAACVALAHVPAVRQAIGSWQPNAPGGEQNVWTAGAVFTGVVALLVAAGVPRLALWTLGGVAFGLARGLLFAEVGTVLGSYATFCFMRWAGRDAVLRKWPVLDRYAHRLGRGGWATVLVARVTPVSSLLVNATLALTRVRHTQFLLASAVGFLPEGVPVVLLGAAGRKLDQGMIVRSVAYVLAGVAVLVLGAVLLMRYRRRADAGDAAAEPEPPQEGQGATETAGP
jgi:uncharacterized membrane protein YdjX (TVP38/TMEM64 family)